MHTKGSCDLHSRHDSCDQRQLPTYPGHARSRVVRFPIASVLRPMQRKIMAEIVLQVSWTCIQSKAHTEQNTVRKQRLNNHKNQKQNQQQQKQQQHKKSFSTLCHGLLKKKTKPPTKNKHEIFDFVYVDRFDTL